MGIPKSQYEDIVEAVLVAVSQQQGVYLAGVVLLKTKSIPKTTSGKISRNACRINFFEKKLDVLHEWDDLETATTTPQGFKATNRGLLQNAEAATPQTLEEVKRSLVEMVKETTQLITVSDDAVLEELGINSLTATELSSRITEKFKVKIRPTFISTSPTINDIAVRIVELAKNSALTRPNVNVVALNQEKTSVVGGTGFIRPEGHIAGWGLALPLPVSTGRFLQVDKEERTALEQSEETIQQMATFVASSHIKTRYSCHPRFLEKDKQISDYPNAVGVVKKNIFIDPQAKPLLRERMSYFDDTCVKLCVEAARNALKSWGRDAGAITHILTTCTSGWREPGIACAVMKELGLSQDTQKAELNFNGCFCGATCLRLARDIIRAGDAEAVMIVACEVASTHYDWSVTDTELMIAQALFADGAASIIVAKEGVWKYCQTGCSVIPDSGHLLGLRPPLEGHEQSYVMTLSKYVAPSLYDYFAKGHGQNIMYKLYIPDDPRPAVAVHPGGPRILEAVSDVLSGLGWEDDALAASFDTFGKFGNLGSAAMLFVLANMLSSSESDDGRDFLKDHKKLITMAFGPGVTVEYALLERST